MGDIAKGVVIGVVVAILMLGLLLESEGLLFPNRQPAAMAPATAAMVRLGPDGPGDSVFGEDLTDAVVPASEGYDLCLGELRVLRPSMMTSSMPDSFCTVRRGDDGKWLVSTGGWQSCTVTCVKLGG
ncbi:MAG: hypothetical protein F9K43_17965 [Bauldia sp.]|nr:MAG: hypothetical protein F9K43_17965 [Bauldia sp.]